MFNCAAAGFALIWRHSACGKWCHQIKRKGCMSERGSFGLINVLLQRLTCLIFHILSMTTGPVQSFTGYTACQVKHNVHIVVFLSVVWVQSFNKREFLKKRAEIKRLFIVKNKTIRIRTYKNDWWKPQTAARQAYVCVLSCLNDIFITAREERGSAVSSLVYHGGFKKPHQWQRLKVNKEPLFGSLKITYRNQTTVTVI